MEHKLNPRFFYICFCFEISEQNSGFRNHEKRPTVYLPLFLSVVENAIWQQVKKERDSFALFLRKQEIEDRTVTIFYSGFYLAQLQYANCVTMINNMIWKFYY